MVNEQFMMNVVNDTMRKSRTRKSSVRAELDDLWTRANAFGYGFNNLDDGVVRITDEDEDLAVIVWDDNGAHIESVADRIRDTMIVGTDPGDALDAKAIGDALRALRKGKARKSRIGKMYANDMTEEDEYFVSILNNIQDYSKRLDNIEVPLEIITDSYYFDQATTWHQYLDYGWTKDILDKYTKNGAQYHQDKFKEIEAKWEKLMNDTQEKALKIIQDYIKAYDRVERELERSEEYKKLYDE